jgi:hypothetical protein
VAESDIDIVVAGDDLGDVRAQAVHDRVGEEHPSEVVRCVAQRLAGDVGEPGPGQRGVEHAADGAAADRPVLGSPSALEQERGRPGPSAFVPVIRAPEAPLRRRRGRG